MKLHVGIFSWVTYGAVHIFFIGLVWMTIRKWMKSEFISREFPVIVAVSSVCASMLATSDLICSGFVSGYTVSDIGFAAMPLCVLLMADGGRPVWKVVSVAVFAVSLAVCILRLVPFSVFLAGHVRGIMMLVAVVVAACVVSEYIWRRVNAIKDWFGQVTAVKVIEDRVNMMYLLLLLACQSMGDLAGNGTGWLNCLVLCLSLVFVLGLYSGIYWRLMTGQIFLVLRKRESEFREAMKVCMTDVDRSACQDDVCYSTIFERLVAYFEKEKPYLNGNLNIADVSRQLMTNKSYLSRTINKYTGRNFCQYVNYYRIRHSVEIFHADPGLKLADLAVMSGFHSIASFSMAFRLYMNETPGEWCRKHKATMCKK